MIAKKEPLAWSAAADVQGEFPWALWLVNNSACLQLPDSSGAEADVHYKRGKHSDDHWERVTGN